MNLNICCGLVLQCQLNLCLRIAKPCYMVHFCTGEDAWRSCLHTCSSVLMMQEHKAALVRKSEEFQTDAVSGLMQPTGLCKT